MICDPLPTTGVDAGVVVLVALALLTAGALLVRSTRSRRTAAGTLALVLAVGSVAVLAAPSPAAAAGPDCYVAANSLTITQTSTMSGLAPGVAPAAITGLVVNNGTDSTVVVAIDVAIAFVTLDPDAPAGTCDASDYLLTDTRMPIGRTLDPGGSATFAGASIGFSDKSTNQDACQHATVALLYTTAAS
ncbi:MAG TPA: hypothetical protein VGC57_13385 [Cellulomonas sp.]